jgi:hypothetical protein
LEIILLIGFEIFKNRFKQPNSPNKFFILKTEAAMEKCTCFSLFFRFPILSNKSMIVICTYHKARKCFFASASTVYGAEALAEAHKWEHLQNIF